MFSWCDSDTDLGDAAPGLPGGGFARRPIPPLLVSVTDPAPKRQGCVPLILMGAYEVKQSVAIVRPVSTGSARVAASQGRANRDTCRP